MTNGTSEDGLATSGTVADLLVTNWTAVDGLVTSGTVVDRLVTHYYAAAMFNSIRGLEGKLRAKLLNHDVT